MAAIKSRQSKIAQQKQEAELLESIRRRPEEARLAAIERRKEEQRLQKEYEEQLAREQKEADENYSQFYGRVR
jgi:hypothetical protein